VSEIGFSLSSEEHSAPDLVRYAQRAGQAGFQFALISDHFHPWIDRQGQSPFVWAVLGAIAERTQLLHVGTGVTCSLIRIHPRDYRSSRSHRCIDAIQSCVSIHKQI
jgi:alkanesulfonate monooxygenase SsuD/methylene tetrahydromethanopterin reductase-like flavin-dependent oxidoreductase (luciferase family)